MDTQNRKFLKMSSSPHVHTPVTTQKIMLDVILALLPALIWSIYVLGIRSLFVTLVSVASCVVFEFLYRKIMRKPDTISDLSAVVTGILLAFCLPVTMPYWTVVAGAFFAIVIVKQLYGGIGKNVVNPALAARVFMFMSFSSEMSAFTEDTADAVAGATPLVNLQQGKLPEQTLFDMFLGDKPGCIGELSVTLILLGGLYLLFRKVITWHIPVSFLATVAVIAFIFPTGDFLRVYFTAYELCSGGLMLGAFFMATDYVTSPVTSKGRIIYGIGCGLITMFIRYFGYPEGVSFAILIMNLFTLALDKLTMPTKFGGGKSNASK